jgi:hypothetical protein
MATPPEPPGRDPDNIPETLCLGKFNITVNSAGLVTITFTNVRPKIGPLPDSGQIEDESVVRARIVTTIDNAATLRDVLNSMIQNQPGTPATASGGSSKLN